MIGAQVFDAAGQRWTLLLGNAAQCQIEEQYERGFFAVVADAMPNLDPATALIVAQAMSAGVEIPADLGERAMNAMRGIRVSVLRDLAWAGLQRHHPGTSLDQVSDIIDALGQARFGDLIARAIRAAQGQEVADDGASRKPPRATRRRAPTGTPS